MRSRMIRLLVIGFLTASACGTRVEHGEARSTNTPPPSAGASVPVAAQPIQAASGVSAPQANSATAPEAAAPVGTATTMHAVGGSRQAAPASQAAPGSSRPTGSAAPAPSSAASSGGSQAGPSGLAPGVPAPGAPSPTPADGTRTPLVIGTIGTLSGPIGSVVVGGVEAIQMWAKAINARGGLNGHQVKHIAADDGGDQARHRALVQEFVENKKVLAFVGNPEVLTGASSVEYLTQKRVPVIGSDGGGLYFYDSPMYFPHAPHGIPLLHALFDGYARGALSKGKDKAALFTCVEVAICRSSHDVWVDDAKQAGIQIVYRAQVSLTQPDFTSECLQAQRAGAQMIATAIDANSVTRIAASCNRQGYHPMLGIGSATVAPHHVDDPNLDGSVVALPNFPWFMDNTPGRKEFQDVLAKYGGGKPATGPHANGWVAAKVLERAGAALSEPPTSQSILDGLWTINGDDLGGLTVPLRFIREQKAPVLICSASVFIQNKQWAPVDGGAIKCRP